MFTRSLRLKRLSVLLVVILIGAVGVVQAQLALQETYVSDDGAFSFHYPSGWKVGEDGGVTLTNATGVVTLTFIPPSPLFRDTSPDRAMVSTLRARGLKAGDVKTVDVFRGAEARTVAEAALEDGRLALGVKFTEGGTGIVLVDGPYPLFITTAEAVARSFDRPDAQAAPGVCLVGTTAEDTARVRVGPGENRSSIAFLPAGKNFAPLAQGTDADGARWFRLDRDAAPGKAANEFWVAEADVVTDGDCAALPSAEAPPIVPLATPEATGEPGG